jgi:hypothetical protein
VSSSYDSDGLFDGFTFRFETGFKKSPPSYQFDSAAVTQTQTSTTTKLEFSTGADGWDTKHAWSSEAFTRGVGTYRGRFPYGASAACICLCRTPIQDGDDDTSQYMVVGINTSGDLQYTIDGTTTVVPTGTWNPNDNDYYQFARNAGHIAIQASTDGVNWTTIHTNTLPDIPLVLYPGVISYDDANDVDKLAQIPDGNVYDDGITVGTRSPDDPYFRANPADGATLHDDGLGTIKRDGGGSIMSFDPGALAETLGFSGPPANSGVTRTWSFENDIAIDPRAEHPALIVSLPQLQLRSRSGVTGQTGSILAVLPRMSMAENGTLVYEPRISIPVGVSFARETPVNTITVEIRQSDGTPASLRGVSVVTIWVS